MTTSIFDDKILHLARNRVGINKSAFVDANAMGGQDGSAQAAASAPPQGGGASPMAPPAAMPAMGADPTAQALDPAAGGPNPLEARIAALEAGTAGGAKPGGSKGGGKGEQELVLKQILNMMSILFDTLGIPVPTQAMVPDSVTATAQPQAQAQAGGQDPSQGAAGPSSVLGQPPGPPQPVTPLTSVLGSPGAGGGDSGGAPAPKSAAVKAAANWGGIAITPAMLRSVTQPEPATPGQNGVDARRILGLR